MRQDVFSYSIGRSHFTFVFFSRIDGRRLERRILRGLPLGENAVRLLAYQTWDVYLSPILTTYYNPVNPDKPTKRLRVGGKWINPEIEQSRDEALDLPASGPRS